MCIYCLKPYPKERRFTEIKMGRNRMSGYFIHNLSLTVAVVNSESEEANLQEKCACLFFKICDVIIFNSNDDWSIFVT